MTDLKPLCALGAPEPRSVQLGKLSLRECPEMGLASLALRGDADRPTLDLPEPGRWQASDPFNVFWTGPDQWMVEAPGQGDADVAAQVQARAPGASVTEQTDGWVLIAVTSSAGAAPLTALLERAVNLDPARLAPGCAVRTAIEHMGVLVIRRAEGELGIWGMRSAAESLWHALTTMARRLEA